MTVSFIGTNAKETSKAKNLAFVVFDTEQIRSIFSSIEQFREAACIPRERVSVTVS